MSKDRERLLELLLEAERLATDLKEGIAAFQIRMAITELTRKDVR